MHNQFHHDQHIKSWKVGEEEEQTHLRSQPLRMGKLKRKLEPNRVSSNIRINIGKLELNIPNVHILTKLVQMKPIEPQKICHDSAQAAPSRKNFHWIH
ncbi:hypothetical protein EYC84_008393 [Monilinia fructicola]|uniref:Uncharacterized protein n=1 Tax=Monilinia fructicola TaxID=38448 RepID=A0A5M9JJF9_MONFR|nr:hypothetical protein EYC84_008393 [Monilinia fructicola]